MTHIQQGTGNDVFVICHALSVAENRRLMYRITYVLVLGRLVARERFQSDLFAVCWTQSVEFHVIVLGHVHSFILRRECHRAVQCR